MTANDLKDRLLASANDIGWSGSDAPEFVSPRFRGRPDASTAALPAEANGLRLGAYPVIVAPVTLGTTAEMQATLRLLHSQMVIARSYMGRDEVINAHILLCATGAARDADWRNVIDLAERDEKVCRKVVWLPDPAALDKSYEAFRARTFLASPWDDVDEKLNARLDVNQGLASKLLMQAGLAEDSAKQWIDIVDATKGDPDTMVTRLAEVLGGAR
jgi:hypothetical protein